MCSGIEFIKCGNTDICFSQDLFRYRRPIRRRDCGPIFVNLALLHMYEKCVKENTIKYLGICLDIVASTMEYQQLQSETNQKKQIARQPTKKEYNLSKARCRQHYNNNNVYG